MDIGVIALLVALFTGVVMITFEGEVRDGKNDVRISLAVEGLKGRRGLNKRFSVYLNKD